MFALILLFASSVTATANYFSYGQPDREPPAFQGLLSIDELATSGGYSSTNYEVITEDGYSLWLHRLGDNSGPPVLVVHGLGLAADCWLARDPEKSLPHILLSNGYDVWLGNQRGSAFNEYSLEYNRSDPRFWDFSFHEAGCYDLPAFIDTVLSVSGEEKLFYIGHSLGVTVFLVMASTRPEYNAKVESAVLLTPIAYTPTLSELSPAAQLVVRLGNIFINGMSLAKQFEVGRRTEASISFLKSFCSNLKTQDSCVNTIGLLLGSNLVSIHKGEWNISIPYFGAGTSLKTFDHILQLYQTGEFRQYDYGKERNLLKYKNAKPPPYNLKLVTAPVAMIWSQNDPLLSKSVEKRLVSHLPNVILSHFVSDPMFSHMDMYIGVKADKLVYPYIIRVLDSFSKSYETTTLKYFEIFKRHL